MIDANANQAISRHLLTVDDRAEHGTWRVRLEPRHYETRLWQSFERISAAHYHHGSALRLINDNVANSILRPPDLKALEGSGIKLGSVTTRGQHTRQEERLTFEVIAFLAALKSALDFSCIALSQHWPIEQDSVHKALGYAAGRNDPVSKHFNSYRDPLANLQRYRNSLMHRTSLHVTVKSVMMTKGGKVASSTMAVIQKDPPEFVEFSRQAAFEAEPLEFGEGGGVITIKHDDGREEIEQVDTMLMPPWGYATVQDFLQAKVDFVSQFVVDSVNLLDDLLKPL